MSERCECDDVPLAFDALRESEARLRAALEVSDVGTFIWRVADDVIEPDARMRTLLGLPEGDVVTCAAIIQKTIHPIDRSRCAAMFAQVIDPSGTRTLHDEVRVLDASGVVRWLELKGKLVSAHDAASPLPRATTDRRAMLTGVGIDITDRKHREANLDLLDRIADGCARLSSPDEIMKVVGPLLAAYLHVPSVCLLGVDESRDQIRMLHVWNRKGSPVRPDVVRISDFVTPEFREAARLGTPYVVHDTQRDSRTYPDTHEALQVRSFMSVPFIRDGAWKFVFSVCDSRPHHWRDEEVGLFRQLADRVFARLEHALAEQALANDLRDTQLLRDLSVRLVAESDTQAFYDAIVAAAMSITRAKAVCLQLLDTDSRELKLLANDGFGPAIADCLSRVNEKSSTSCGRALAMNAPSVVDYESGMASPDATVRLMVESGIRSAQSTPLITRAGRTVGMLCTKWSEPQRRLSEREIRFVDLLARQAAEFIERRLNENALRESERRLSIELADTQLLQHLSAQLLEGQGTESLYETVVDAATWIMRSQCASLQVFHPERGPRGALRLIASRGFDDAARQRWEWVDPDANTTCARALQTNARVITPDVTKADFIAGTSTEAAMLDAGIRAIQTTPLKSRAGKTVGMISTHWSVPHQPSERDFRLLDILARQAADLIERTTADDALRESERQLKEADRRKDEFLATLAHELRNPLAPLRTSLELIRIAGNSPESVGEVREEMEEQLALLVRLVDDLLDVSRITSGKIRLQRRPTELTALVATAVQANRPAIDQGRIDLSVNLPETRILLDTDPIRFVQVVSNVLHNAVKFTDPGGRITISAELASPDSGPREVVLRIADSGVGISTEMLPRVFDLFTQDDATAYRSQTGLGIGLALARHLIEMHGGSIDAQSDGPGHGSIFTVRMPVAHAVPAVRTAPPVVAPCAGRRVLVVDDNQAGARAMKRLVTALGGECQVAHTGEAGLVGVREFHPDIVILDIGMPGLDGYETCRRIRDEFGSSVVVVALTGWGQERDKYKAMQAGFDLHLTKPADPSLLEGLLATAGRR